jgi:AraC-like DNA-binding protein
MDTKTHPGSQARKRENEAGEERQRELLRAVERHLDHASRSDSASASPGHEMAQDACMSRYHFQRVFRRTVGETPGELRRRVVLERAANTLRTTRQPVTTIALDAGYQSLEGFSRAFKVAFNVSPSDFRRIGKATSNTLLPSEAGVHYHARHNGLLVLHQQTASQERNTTMDLTERLLESDYQAKRRILECARLLTNQQLDAPLAFRHNLMPFVEPERTIREALNRMSASGKDDWVVALWDEIGWKTEDDLFRVLEGDTVDAMIARLESFDREWRRFVRLVTDTNQWETQWVDHSCEPAETFSYGAVIEGRLTWGIPQRFVVQRLMEQMGIRPDDALLPGGK